MSSYNAMRPPGGWPRERRPRVRYVEPEKQRVIAEKKKWAYAALRAIAYTKSEARAMFKATLGVKRLPHGSYIAKVA